LRVDFVSYEQSEMEAMTKRRHSIRFNPAIAPARRLAFVSYTTSWDTTIRRQRTARQLPRRPAAMPEPLLRIDPMFKFVPDTNVPGFRVGVRDDVPGFRVGVPDDVPGFSIGENGSVRRPLPAAPSAAATAPTIFSPAGLAYQGNSRLFPTPYQDYVPVSGGSAFPDPLRQAVDRAGNPYADPSRAPPSTPTLDLGSSTGVPEMGTVRTPPGVSTASGTGNPYDDPGPEIGGPILGALAAHLSPPIPGLGYLLGLGGFRLGNAMQRLHHRGMLDMGNGPSLGVNPVGP
jgi:hypothetical protein